MRMWQIVVMAALMGCGGAATKKSEWKSIAGRDDGQPPFTRSAIYRARVPSDWMEMTHDGSVFDSKLPIAEYIIGSEVRVVVHNFPVDRLENRIAPGAQIARWRNQLQDTDAATLKIAPYGHSGYTGLCFEATGSLDEHVTTVYGWALQLGSDHFQALLHPNNPRTASERRQMVGDVTIKATGTPMAMKAAKLALSQFARSFELIDEVPSR